ncbi:MAG: molybdopterin dinucleotide binding domain-containing protein [Methanoregula sp.]|nr:molybdopterin dinucleotide binding domain-containing protein [Methanoregula sp.]
MKCILNTGRTVPQGASVEHKGSELYSTVASACFLNPVDMMMLGIENGDRVRVTTPAGHIVLTARPAEGVARGEIFVAIGPYANHIISSETHGTGMPDFKSQSVDVEPTEEPIKSVGELMEAIGGLRYDRT